MNYPKEPTPEQCSNRDRVEDVAGCPAYACWYPQMGGYVGKAVVVIDSDAGSDGCFDVFVWHNGDFPFTDDGNPVIDDGDPVRLHHCSPSQFIDFGKFVLSKQEGHLAK